MSEINFTEGLVDVFTTNNLFPVLLASSRGKHINIVVQSKIAYPDESSKAETSGHLIRNFLASKNNFILYHITDANNA